MSSTDEQLPSNPSQWTARAGKEGLIGSTIHTASLKSASTIEEGQYLLFRVLWKAKPLQDFDWKRFDLDRWEDEANALLANYGSWKSYCDGFGRQDIPESTFALVRYFQLQAAETSDTTSAPTVIVTPVTDRTRSKMSLERRLFHTHLETPTRSTGILAGDSESEEELGEADESPVVSESPAPHELRNIMHQQTKDEQIVNTALVNFLSALTLHSGLPNQWSLHPRPFKAHFAHASFEARTDGYLEDTKAGGRVRALIEVKAILRRQKPKPIRMQEAAQMVAWIRSHPDRGGWLNHVGRRVHVSQDRHEIYIVIAEYTDDYIDYLEQDSSTDAYMAMHEFGPWNTLRAEHMKHVSSILVALVLRAVSDCEAENSG